MLEHYKRGATWWARGRIEYQGQPISDYYRCSTGASEEAGAIQWCRAEEERRIRRHLLGDDKALTFAEAVMLYEADAKTATYLIPIVEKVGSMWIKDITPKAVRDLGPQLMPDASTDTWVRQIVTPVRAVIRNAHDLGQCPPISIKGYSREERNEQDLKRGKASRVKKQPGSWEWLLRFRQHADRRHAALALFMFVTGARISQAIEMHPGKHLRLQEGMACVPAAKGHVDRWVSIPPEVVTELANLPEFFPRGWDRNKPENMRVFGFADRSSPRKGWVAACKAAKIPILGFHAAGRHGFGQEMNVRRGLDEKAAGEFGGWADTSLMKRTYTHAEDTAEKIHEAFRAGLEEAESSTGLKLAGAKA